MNEEMMKKMAESVNPNFPEGAQEIAELLTFLPEQIRMYMVMNFSKNICKM